MSPMPPGRLVHGVLSPLERWAEILFGVIMALTITGALSVSSASREESRAMFAAALGCNIAWGLVDAVMYLLTVLFEQGRESLLARAIRSGEDDAHLRAALGELVPEHVLGALTQEDLGTLRRRLVAAGALPDRARLHVQDLLAALGVFLLVVASTIPVALPFLVIGDPVLAMRVSRAISLGLLFVSGSAVGRYAGLRSWAVGLSMLGVGAVLVAAVTALGG